MFYLNLTKHFFRSKIVVNPIPLYPFGGINVKRNKALTAMVTLESYNKMQVFLQEYNKRTGEFVTMSTFVWKAIKYYVNKTVKEWKQVP